MRLVLALVWIVLAAPLAAAGGYDRDSFGRWRDSDGDCLNTRHELLAQLSTTPVSRSENQCRIVHGRWFDPYTGRSHSAAAALEIDHLVPLRWAWDRGARDWSAALRRQFFNDTRFLVPTQAAVNRAKGASGPLDWLPPDQGFHCTYLTRFRRAVLIYDLTLAPDERRRLDSARRTACAIAGPTG